jgi:hypothetical protein
MNVSGSNVFRNASDFASASYRWQLLLRASGFGLIVWQLLGVVPAAVFPWLVFGLANIEAVDFPGGAPGEDRDTQFESLSLAGGLCQRKLAVKAGPPFLLAVRRLSVVCRAGFAQGCVRGMDQNGYRSRRLC